MTTTVKRGAGRPAAQAKTAKAAQRTPLPADQTAEMEQADRAMGPEMPKVAPKRPARKAAKATPAKATADTADQRGAMQVPLGASATDDDAREAIAATVAETVTKMTPLKGTSHTTGKVHFARQERHLDQSVKGMMLVQICGMGRAQRTYLAETPAEAEVTCKRCLAIRPDATPAAATPPAPAETSDKPGKAATRSESHPERRAGSGPAKLARLTAELEPFGWKISAKTGPGNRIEATAKRGTETLRQVWVDGSYDYGTSVYKDGETVTRKVRNLSEAIRLCARKAEVA
jgi:hypothetical protein